MRFLLRLATDAFVSDLEDGRWDVQFRRELAQLELLRSLLDRLRGGGTILAKDDKIVWALERHGCFTTNSLYRHKNIKKKRGWHAGVRNCNTRHRRD
jgi:uncharacterized protein (DUF1697 family)